MKFIRGLNYFNFHFASVDSFLLSVNVGHGIKLIILALFLNEIYLQESNQVYTATSVTL